MLDNFHKRERASAQGHSEASVPQKNLRPHLFPILLWLFLVPFLSYSYFHHGQGDNENSRMDLVLAIVERHTVSIDAYADNTGDKGIFKSHYYSTKAPGLALSAVPVVAMVLALVHTGEVVKIAEYAATTLVVSLPTALAVACLFWIIVRLRYSVAAAVLTALVFGMGTPIFLYATVFWGHATTSAFLVFAFAALVEIADCRDGRFGWWGFVLGASAGWATVVEYPSAVPAALLACVGLIYGYRHGRRVLIRVIIAEAVGALICAAILGLYQWVAFGSPFHLGYQSSLFRATDMKAGFLGLTYPKWSALLGITFGLQRGIFLHSPVLLIACVGVILSLKNAQFQPLRVAAILIVVYFVLFNASYTNWWGGWSYGPRYLSPGLPFLCFGLAEIWVRGRRTSRVGVIGLSLLGFATTLAGVATTHVWPKQEPFPVKSAMHAFFNGQLMGDRRNVGLVLGLHGLRSLLPLLAFWIAALAVAVSYSYHKQRHRKVAV